jgi:hypothetical protein
MNFEERRQYVYDMAKEILEESNTTFVNMCEELDSYNGFLGDDRLYDMSMFDEIMSGKTPLEIAHDLEDNNFSTNDDYFQFTIYGVESTNDKYDAYSSLYGADAVLDNLIDNYSNVYFDNPSLKEFVAILADEDFGIDDDEEVETDEEFTERIDAI